MTNDVSFLPNEPEAITTAIAQPERLHTVRSRVANTTDRPSDEIHDQSSRLPFRRLIAAYLCLSIIYFTSSLDINSVALALPVIARDLGAGSSITWTGTAYLMGQAAFQPLYGRLSDIIGRKPVLMLSVGFLVFGDILCANSHTPAWLYACRAISGIGGGGISSIISIIVSDLVSLKDRGKYQGMLNASIGAGSAIGPFLAAALIQKMRIAGISSWRWIFYIPPVLACVSAIASLFFLPLTDVSGSWKAKARQIDWMGLAASLVATICILIPLNLGGTSWAWSSPAVISLMIIGGVAVAVFTIIEKKYARIPLIPLRLFTSKASAILLIQSALYNIVWQVDMYFLPTYLQDVRGFSPLQASALMLPILLFSSVSGIFYDYIYHPGIFLWLFGVCLKMMFSQTTSVGTYLGALLVEGWGIGCVFQPGLVALHAHCPPKDRAVATSTRNLFRMLGSVIGMTIATALQSAVTQAALSDNVPASVLSQVKMGTWRFGTTSWDQDISYARFKGFQAVFAMEIPFMVLCFLGCFGIPSATLGGDDQITERDDHFSLQERN
ncbi:hypothetical protein M441DRAFT_154917 [Trichoderma asperellum CBS 433.97]|uniref:Major facilitator superfamily (MFS) profile domain-containing protein n=1 Tax=Trichoderma asperellum (strain ATCC 204424 / CBS 433.97 / NBRC 101777) TaxID=1042311 RepID=A0A2T3YQH3_TRIA4|nr:hypothetical protein M441DRAFT_154917 [Trichoderma asperellum CBS 433.97]PTB34769.1 hypothetical protein M441DRAFT_154917 [Trichoderma asperellum CBS 433.97]